jgi:hypothetical protein
MVSEEKAVENKSPLMPSSINEGSFQKALNGLYYSLGKIEARLQKLEERLNTELRLMAGAKQKVE